MKDILKISLSPQEISLKDSNQTIKYEETESWINTMTNSSDNIDS